MAAAFVWGAATSAHQVEGNNIHNDWWEWEVRGKVAYRSGSACDHYRRFDEDFALAAALGHTAHRLSLEWSRIELAPGQYQSAALEHYRDVLRALKQRNLKTFVTLHHFTNPRWFARQGGWEHPRAALQFGQYVRVVAQALGDLVDVWITINEPNIYALKGYWEGVWPPGQRHHWRAVERVTRHFAAAHQEAYRIIHQSHPAAKVGIAQSVVAFLPARADSRLDQLVVQAHNWYYNHRFFQLTRGCHDFIGLNYYYAAGRKFSGRWPFFTPAPLPYPQTKPLAWSIYPSGLTRLLQDFKRYQLPIYITENGLPDADDHLRGEFIRQHIRAIEAAQQQGADVRGYFHWSLLDNFEWAEGFTPRFGLVAVDFATQERAIRPSARVYQAIINQAQN